ncbi:MAG: hypothetical protein NC131_14070 [Roseburia sp.]|nr:hypothetical protein [Roseburia sp.]
MHIELSNIKSAMLPVAMIGGALFYKWMGYVTFLSPYLIFAMLLITYCKLDFKDFKPKKEHFLLLGVQMLFSAIVYLSLVWFNHTIAEGVFICVFIPTATAAPVITSMLGGKISFVATYSLICNTFVAVTAPLILAFIGDNQGITFIESAIIICSKVFPLIMGPLVIAMLLKYAMPSLHRKINSHQQLSFYLWAISLFIIVGSCVSFTINTWDINNLGRVIALVVGALVVCLLQFIFGRMVGAKFNDKISVGQSLGQKNTVLAVWLALTYMVPIASIAPAAYIAWQNIVNSWQIMNHNRKS